MNDGCPPDSAIYLPPVTYAEDQYDDTIILNFADEPIVTHPVCPKLTERRALHCFPNATRIVQFRYSFIKKFQDALGVLRVQLG
jgi:hypothetical protein